MTKLKLLLGLLLACMVWSPLQAVGLDYGHTNYGVGGIGVGDPRPTPGTYAVVTGVAYVDRWIPLSQVKQVGGVLPVGVSATVLVPGTALGATEAYHCVATGLTNHAAVCLPASDTATFSVDFQVPDNYRSGGVLVLGLHTSTALTENITITADVYANTYNSATTTAKTAGTAVPVTDASIPAVRLLKIEATNTATFTPGQKVSWKVTVAGTVPIKQLTGMWFRYRPWGAFF